jgi:tryptophanyl-tRNA synthetase
MADKVVFSGIKPSGKPHLGNYIGAIKHWVTSQEQDGKQYFCVVDMHAITVEQDPGELKENVLELAGLLLASGIDPVKSTFFIQSHNPDHANLGWILNCYASMGQMSRMTQYKEKSEGKDFVSVGLFDYPALMAADILLYNTTEVPVGEDQKQHVELTRDIAQRFNSRHGETFVLPEPVIPELGARIMSLSDPTKKMSKSTKDPSGTINIMDSPEEIAKKIMGAVTDNENKVAFDEKRPGISNLMQIYGELSGKSMKEIESEFENSGYGNFKKAVADVVISTLTPIQKKYEELTVGGELEKILKEGAQEAYSVSHKKLEEVYEKVGFTK